MAVSLSSFGKYPSTRMRRLRGHDWIRCLVREHELAAHHLILPLFVHDGKIDTPIASMPDVSRLSFDGLLEKGELCLHHGLKAVALFPVIDEKHKDETGSHALDEDNLFCRAIRHLKKHHPSLGIISDVALDPFTSHGHDGIVQNGVILNDETVSVLSEQALLQARAGADIIAPSDMMDGRIGIIRQALDAHDFQHILLLSYGAKYASSFYGPFRDAVGSSSSLGVGDKRTYQMDGANIKEALREVALDIEEGADLVMVKPALPYLDVISGLSQTTCLPIFAYQVSGEYAMLKVAARAGMIEYDKALVESLLAMRRAGARAILSYGALDAAQLL